MNLAKRKTINESNIYQQTKFDLTTTKYNIIITNTQLKSQLYLMQPGIFYQQAVFQPNYFKRQAAIDNGKIQQAIISKKLIAIIKVDVYTEEKSDRLAGSLSLYYFTKYTLQFSNNYLVSKKNTVESSSFFNAKDHRLIS